MFVMECIAVLGMYIAGMLSFIRRCIVTECNCMTGSVSITQKTLCMHWLCGRNECIEYIDCAASPDHDIEGWV